MAELSVICPRCGERNSIIAVDVRRSEIVACSRCKHEMGRLDQLEIQSDKAKADRQQRQADC